MTIRFRCYHCVGKGRTMGTSGYGSHRFPRCHGGYIEVVCPIPERAM